jgi:hypothetical protein
MSFSSELRRALARHGVDARRARRIVAELEDHRACDPDAALGSPELIAERFAAELRVAETRRATLGGFAALAATAVGVLAVSMAISAAGGWPEFGGTRSVFVVLAGVALIIGGQVSFVAGVLAVWALLRRGGDLWLVQRRMRVALVAAAVVVAGEATNAIALHSSLPGWWFALAASVALVAGIGLGAAGVSLRRAAALTPEGRSATVGVPAWFVLGTGLVAFALMTAGTAHAERSWIEGVIRGGLEVVAFACGYVALGRVLGLRTSLRDEIVPTLRR